MWASLVVQTGKSLLAMQETWVRSLRWKDLLEKEVATHSCLERIPRTEEPGRLQPWGRKESAMTERLTVSLLLGKYIIL